MEDIQQRLKAFLNDEDAKLARIREIENELRAFPSLFLMAREVIRQTELEQEKEALLKSMEN